MSFQSLFSRSYIHSVIMFAKVLPCISRWSRFQRKLLGTPIKEKEIWTFSKNLTWWFRAGAEMRSRRVVSKRFMMFAAAAWGSVWRMLMTRTASTRRSVKSPWASMDCIKLISYLRKEVIEFLIDLHFDAWPASLTQPLQPVCIAFDESFLDSLSETCWFREDSPCWFVFRSWTETQRTIG